MAELWYNDINRNVDWGGDASTDNLPVAGSAVQKFIKSELNNKIGVIYHDEVSSSHLCFAHEDDLQEYLNDRSKTYLILSSFIAPSSYKAKVVVDSYYKAVLINSKENYLTFDYEITNNDEIFTDNVRYEIVVTKNGKSSTLNGTGIFGKSIAINIDEFLTTEGSTEMAVTITGQITGAVATAIITYEVVNLVFESSYDVSKVYDLTAEIIDPLVVNYSIFGTSNIKYIDWYIDNQFIETDIIQGGTAEAVVDNKRISVVGLEHGVHNLQFRAYVVVNGENFYTDTLYAEFMVVSDLNDKNSMIAIETTIPKIYGIVKDVKLYNIVQYELTSINYGVYNPKKLEYVPVEIYLNNELSTTVNAPNNKELTYSFTPNISGNINIKFKTGDYEKSLIADVTETTMDIQDITSNLVLDLSASGRTNQDADKDQWTFGDYSTTFTGFNWSTTSGWNNNRLVVYEGMSITTNIKPLSVTSFGKTIEIEFESSNVTNDDAVICDLRNEGGLGLVITATKASMIVGYGNKEQVSTNYKANELVRVSFVLDSTNKLALVYVNGIVSGAVAMTSNLSIDKYLTFTGSSDAGIKIKQIRIYDTQLSSEQILNNYILYRDSITEIKSLYKRNDVLDGKLISIDKIADFIPVVLLTGEDIFWLESQKDTDIEIKIDVEYINKQDPTHQFKFYGGCCRIQGTSSAGYVRKNWRIYSKRKERYVADVYDWQGVLSTDKKRRIAFKEGAVPVNCWTMKADYAESSSTHNTGVATLWNDVMFNAYHTTNGYICRTKAQTAALANSYEYDCRTTVDGFPIVVFARRNDTEDYTFMGKYNFNNDKSTENVFGFCDIPGFDDAYVDGHEGETIPEGEMNAGKPYTYGNKMQCWEMCENFDNYALFKTTEGWYDNQLDENGNPVVDEDNIEVKSWASGFEARYPDDGNEADTSDLKAFADWLIGCGDNHEKFAMEKKDHLDIWKIAAYYVYLYRFGAVDQVVKNSMFTSEDGKHWYYINYDNDTILGLDNSGSLSYPPTITRDTKSGATYAYAGRESRLWNMLEADTEFMTYYVPEVDNALFGGGLKYDNVLYYFNTRQSDKWCERVYNEDAAYKYIAPYTKGTVNTLFMMHGSRKAHRTWWLSKRFQLMDAKFNNDNYKGKFIHLKLDGSPGAEFKIKASDYMYFGAEYNKNPLAMGIELNSGEEYTFYKPSAAEDPVNGKDFAVGDPIYIYSPLYIEELDLSKVSKYIYVLEFGKVVDEVVGNKMKKLVIGGEKSAKPLNTLSGLTALTNLEYLDLTGVDIANVDISNLYLLKTLILTDSSINTLTLPEGCAIEELYINKALRKLELNSLSNLTFDGIHGLADHHISSINISNSPALSNDFSFFYEWAKDVVSGDELNVSGLHWTEIAPENLLDFRHVIDAGGKLNLKGKIEITQPTIEQVEALQSLFGADCFTNNAELWIFAPESVFIHGPKEVRSGDSNVFTTTIFSENPGTIEWQIESGAEYVTSIVSNDDNTGVLTTIEYEDSDHTVIIKAIHKPSIDTDSSYYRIATYEILVKKVIYSKYGSIEGNATIKADTNFTLLLGPDDYNGDYNTTWELTGESSANGDVTLSNKTRNSVTVNYVNQVIFESCQLIAHVTNKNWTKHDVVLNVTITDDSVLMTSTSNPEVIAICYAQGWCKSPDVMYKTEAQVVTDIGNVFQGGSHYVGDQSVPRPGASIKSFVELEEFKNITAIPDQAFFQCSNLTEITIPINVQSLGMFAFGSTNLTHVKIPNSVSSINYTAFDGSPIESFDTGSNINYKTTNGILRNADGILVKYPEGRLDKEYTTDENITGLGAWSIKNTNLEVLNIGDNVVSHSDRSISNNKYLTTINLGSGISAKNLAINITTNDVLVDINVSDNHQFLCSVDGVVYDYTRSTVWKYPEGRNYINLDTSATKIGNHALSACLKLSDLNIPDHIEIIAADGVYACQNVKQIIFNDTSRLHTLEDRAFQLASKATFVQLPASLKTVKDLTFGNCFLLGEILFLGNEAPTITETSFGDKKDNWAGRDAKTRIIRVPANSTGYDSDIWNSTVFSDDRSYDGVDYKYTISGS